MIPCLASLVQIQSNSFDLKAALLYIPIKWKNVPTVLTVQQDLAVVELQVGGRLFPSLA